MKKISHIEQDSLLKEKLLEKICLITLYKTSIFRFPSVAYREQGKFSPASNIIV